jgi:hypothetical protein
MMSSAVGGDGRKTVIARRISIGHAMSFNGVLNGNAVEAANSQERF